MSDESSPSSPGVETTLLQGRQTETAASDADSCFPLEALFGIARPENQEVAPTVGRFSILHELGQGGMGVVYLGYDARLDRRAAVKLLRPGRGGEVARTRMLREAQALARLSHPNVVPIYESGEHGDDAYIAMEYVDGVTLRDWVRDAERSTAEVLEVLVAAGRGLAAAHEQGLTHRDFKPDNVMIGTDGRVRVMDFGLARAEDDEGEAVSIESTLERNPGKYAFVSPLTQTGTMLGTPAYMSLEQFEGRLADARSDQFGFCVALYEALYGERPFAGDTLESLRRAVEHGKVRPAPTGSSGESPRGAKVPAWVRKIVERGLLPDPDARWPSLTALLDALDRDPKKFTRWWMAGAVALTLVVGAYTYDRVADNQLLRDCQAEGVQIDELWDADTRAAVRAVFVGTPLAFADDSWQRVDEGIIEYAGEWKRARVDNCVAGEIAETRSAELVELTRECLDDHRDALAREIEKMRADHDSAPTWGPRAISKLPPVSACSDDHALRSRPRPPPDRVVAVTALRRRVVAAEGLAELEGLLAEAEALGWLSLVAQTRVRVAYELDQAGQYLAARDACERAFLDALEAGDGETSLAAVNYMIWLVGVQLGEPEEGLRWGRIGEALVARAAGSQVGGSASEDTLNHALLLGHIGIVHRRRGDYPAALDYYERTLAIEERVLGPDHPSVGGVLSNIGIIHRKLGDDDKALSFYRRALALELEVYGDNHPQIAPVLTNIGMIYRRRGELDAALDYYGRALAIYEALAPDHPRVADVLTHIAGVHDAGGDEPLAVALRERALSIRERTYGTRDTRVADVCLNLGENHLRLDDSAAALPVLRRALAIYEGGVEPSDPRLPMVLRDLGEALLGRGDATSLAEGRAHLERALALHQHPDAKPDPDAVAATKLTLARLEAAAGDGAPLAEGMP